MGQKKLLPPKVKRMKRQGRLNVGRAWLNKYDGKNVLRGYCKHFAVDWRCAAIELEILGVKIDPNYLAQREKAEAELIKRRSVKKQPAGLFPTDCSQGLP